MLLTVAFCLLCLSRYVDAARIYVGAARYVPLKKSARMYVGDDAIKVPVPHPNMKRADYLDADTMLRLNHYILKRLARFNVDKPSINTTS